jgi:hypothetical protein
MRTQWGCAEQMAHAWKAGGAAVGQGGSKWRCQRPERLTGMRSCSLVRAEQDRILRKGRHVAAGA